MTPADTWTTHDPTACAFPGCARGDSCDDDQHIAWTRAEAEAWTRTDAPGVAADARTPDVADPAHQPISTPLAVLIRQLGDVPARRLLLGDLLALGEIAALHGQPRDGKSWAADEMAIAVATGGVAFGLARLRATAPSAVLLLGNEDAEHARAARGAMLLAGRALVTPPPNIHFCICQGCNLDDRDWQDRVIAEVRALSVRLVICDPLRSLTTGVDQGPRELQPFAMFLRRLIRETGVCLLLVHHDTKPAAGNIVDTRRRAQRASGGALFSIVDAPIHVERVDERRSLVAPDGFKHTADPASFVFERRHEGHAVRLVAMETGTAATATEVTLQAHIRAALIETPGASGRVIAKAVKAHKQSVLDCLKRMLDAGLVDAVDGARRATLWTLRS